MSARGRRLAAAIAGLIGLLFVGRWTTRLLADRWWAAELSPSAVGFLTDWHVLRLVLDAGAVLVAAAWFIGHLLLVYRSVGSVQVPRHVGNLEFREAVTPGVLLAGAVTTGALLGLLAGAGRSGAWAEVALAWHGLTYGTADPLLGRDLGVYVAQLPLWRLAHGFALLLVLLALTGLVALYVLLGAIRWIEGRPALTDHARAHLGWLLAALALCLAWGYLLEPYEAVAGLRRSREPAAWRSLILPAPVLAGLALAAAACSALWALRARHALAAGAWLLLGAASVIAHWLLPAAERPSAAPSPDPQALRRLEVLAFALEPLRTDSVLEPAAVPPEVPSLWTPAAVAHMLAGDSVELVSVDPAILRVGSARRPVWLAARATDGGGLAVLAIADDHTSPSGEPLFYAPGDTVGRPAPTPLLELGGDALRPDAPTPFRLRPSELSGVPVGGWGRRLVLAWALQAGRLLGGVAPDARIDWRLSPTERLAHLAPFATWGAPTARLIDRQLVWVVDGYLISRTFPLVGRVEWRGRRVGSVRAAFVGTVDAESGATHIYLRPDADRLAEAWTAIAGGVVEPAAAIPEALLLAMAYPGELFAAQAQALDREPRPGEADARRPAARAELLPRAEVVWSPDTSGPTLVAPLGRPGDRRLGTLVLGSRDHGRDVLRLVRLDSAAASPGRAVLEARWVRFPSFQALVDSIREDGGRVESGPVRFDVTRGGAAAYQPHYARSPATGVAITWVSVAAGERLGAGRTLAQAWSNLLGATVPVPPGPGQTTRLEAARQYLERADSALRAGDWAAFGRAYEGLRRTLGASEGGRR